jgi:hypothetical protein
LAAGKGDGKILEWTAKHSRTKPQPWQIAAWSAFYDQRGPNDVETREDVLGWFDLLDVDDHVSFGGKA